MHHLRISHPPAKKTDIITNIAKPDSQGQSEPRRDPRQSDVRQTIQRCAIVPVDHGGDVGGSIEDQWELGKEGAERFGGEGTD